MQKKKKMKALALLMATVIGATLLPGNAMGVKAAPECASTGNHTDANNDGICDLCNASISTSPSSHTCPPHEDAIAPFGVCDWCGTTLSSTPSTPSTPSTVTTAEVKQSSSGEEKKEEEVKQTPNVREKTAEEIGREKSANEQQEYQEAQKALSDAQSKVTVGGQEVKSTVDGAYTAVSVDGSVITTSKEQLAENFGLQEGQSLRVETWDVTKGNSPQAMQSMEAAAKSVGGELGPVVEVNLKKTPDSRPKANPALKLIVKKLVNDEDGIGSLIPTGEGFDDDLADYVSDKPDEQTFLAKMNDALKEADKLDPDSFDTRDAYDAARDAVFEKYGLGDFDTAEQHLNVLAMDAAYAAQEAASQKGSADMTVGVPEKFHTEGSTYVVAKVSSGGETQILQDKDSNPGTVSFAVSEGGAAYGLVRTEGESPKSTQEKAAIKELQEKADKTATKLFQAANDRHKAVKDIYDKYRGNDQAMEKALDEWGRQNPNIIGLGNDPALNASGMDDAMRSAMGNDDDPILTFSHEGGAYSLELPAMQQYSEEYKAFKEKMNNEPGGVAGPLRTAELMKQSGLNVKLTKYN
ncbi:MAG: hypothetical protein K6B72_06490 [Lachnospiraceae bacterium]|nr:hypothetical protein [Lachnospiraceae bacterium]